MSDSSADAVLSQLRRELADLPPVLRSRLAAAGFRDEALLDLARTIAGLAPEEAAARREKRNRVQGDVAAPRPGDVVAPPVPGSAEAEHLRQVGENALRRGAVAFCVMAGGMATRMGGVVKALVEAIDGKTFLDLRLAENASFTRAWGLPLPLWLMTSDATDAPIRDALAKAGAPAHVRTFQQNLGLRLAPDGHLFRDASGAPSAYATGHGDLVDALKRAGLLGDFVARGGEYVWIANLDNLGATIDPVLLGLFIQSGAELMDEVCAKGGDRGGIPVRVDGKLQVLEEFRLPKTFDPQTVPVFNTNTLLARAAPLAAASFPWTYFEVEKKVDGKTAIQFERLVQELTAHLATVFVEVPREGAVARFLPVKDHEELERRRPTITLVAKARGIVG